MLKEITLENFRAYNDAVTVRLAPITVLIGRNSAGKSTLLKFLLMLQQTIESSGDRFFVTEGSHVMLGRWRELKNSQTKKNNFRYSISLQTDELPPSQIQQLWAESHKRGFVQTIGGAQEIRINLPAASTDAKVGVDPLTDFVIKGNVGYGHKRNTGTHTVTGKQGDKVIFELTEDKLVRVKFLDFAQGGSSFESQLRNFTAEQFLEPLRKEILRLRHLSPVREESEHTIQSGSPPPGWVGHRGEFAIPHMVELLDRSKDKARRDFLAKHIEAVTDIDKLIFKRSGRKMLTEVLATNKHTKSRSYLSDFGFGVSQALPILVQGTLMKAGETLMVEQPEAQIHPTAQLALGSYFADLWTERGIPSIVETHSSNILLRLRRLISQGKLKAEDVSVAFFTTEQPEGAAGAKVVVRNLSINANGALDKGLPLEFFGAEVLEALEFGSEAP